MKDYEEMAKSVLSRRDAYVAERKKRMKKIVTIGSCFCLMLLVCVGVWHTQNSTPIPGDTLTGTITGNISGEGDQDMGITSEELTSTMLDAGYTQAEVEEYQSIGYKMTWGKWWKFFHSIEDNGGDFTLDALKTFSQEELLINTGNLPGGAYVGDDTVADQTSSKNVSWIVNEEKEDITAHEIVKQDYFEGTNEGKQEALTAFGIKPGQYAISDVMYDVSEGKISFEYTISWSPMGNYIRIGLLSEDKKDLYFVSCISGKDEGIIDLTQIPTGKYFVAVYNETSDHLDLDELKGSITYCFQ